MLENNNNRIAKNTAFLYIRMAIVLIVSLYTTRVVLAALGVVDYGVYNVVCGFVTLFSFLNATMSNSIQRYFNYEMGKNGDEAIGNVYVTSLMIQCIIAIIVVLLIETFGLWYVNNKMVIPDERMTDANWVFQFATISLVLVIMQVPFSAAIMAHEKMDYYAIVSVIDALLKLAIALYVKHAVTESRLLFYGACIMGISIFDFLMYFGYSKLKFKNLRFKWMFDKVMFKSMLSFSGWRTMECFAFMMKGQGLNIILNFYFGPVINAANAIAVQVSNAVEGFRTNLFTAFNPQVVQSYADGNCSRTKSLMFGMSKIAFILIFMISLPLVIELDYVLALWLGGEVPEYTSIFTILFIINMLITVFNVPLTIVVGATGHVKRYSIIQTVNVLAIVPLAILALNIIDLPQVVYYVSLSVIFINQIIVTFVARREFPFSIREYLKKVIMPCIVILLISPVIPLLIRHLMTSSFLRLVVICIVSVLIVIATAYFLALDVNEKDMVKSFLNKKLKINIR